MRAKPRLVHSKATLAGTPASVFSDLEDDITRAIDFARGVRRALRSDNITETDLFDPIAELVDAHLERLQKLARRAEELRPIVFAN